MLACCKLNNHLHLATLLDITHYVMIRYLSTSSLVIGKGSSMTQKAAMKFGEHLKMLRELSEVTMTELAERASITVTYISKIESGSVPPPSVGVVKRLCKSLGVDEIPMLEASLAERLHIGNDYEIYMFKHVETDKGLHEVVNEHITALQRENDILRKKIESLCRSKVAITWIPQSSRRHQQV